MNNLDKQYLELLQDILDNGTKKGDRTGTGTLSVFGRQIRHKMDEGYPILTSKKVPFKTMVVELLWFLRGDTDIKYLLDNNCFIWNGDTYQSYLNKCETIERFNKVKIKHKTPIDTTHLHTDGRLYSKDELIERIKNDNEFAKIWGELGPIYGKSWRSWAVGHYGKIDQIQNLINELKTNPDSRRLMVNAWNVGALSKMVLPPCHYSFQFYTRELSEAERYDYLDMLPMWLKRTINIGNVDPLELNNIPKRTISLIWNQRSVDTPLGLPFNIISYALLLMIIAKEVNMIPDELIGNLGDTHIYLNQIDGVKEQLSRTSYPPLPTVEFTDEFNEIMNNKNLTFSQKIDMFKPEHFKLVNYQSHPKIYFPLSN